VSKVEHAMLEHGPRPHQPEAFTSKSEALLKD